MSATKVESFFVRRDDLTQGSCSIDETLSLMFFDKSHTVLLLPFVNTYEPSFKNDDF